MSAESLRRITEGWGHQVEVRRQAEAERASLPGQRDESPRARRVPESRPLTGAANLSTDGAMVLVREEGWKEVKLVAVSAVTVKTAGERAIQTPRPSRRAEDPLVELSDHSYQAGLWDADQMALYQYAEGLRRGLDQAAPLSSVNDGARWIERITSLNFAQATQVVDWSHASQRLWLVANTVWGDQSPAARTWANAQLDRLWQGESRGSDPDLGCSRFGPPRLARRSPGSARLFRTQSTADAVCGVPRRRGAHWQWHGRKCRQHRRSSSDAPSRPRLGTRPCSGYVGRRERTA